jgi:hypothetical protein
MAIVKPPHHSTDPVPNEALSRRRGSQWSHVVHLDGKHEEQVCYLVTPSQKPLPGHCSSHPVGEADPKSGGVV